MASALELRHAECKNPLARLLYNHNPFYLISCFLILYGLQIAAPSGGNFYARPLILVGGMAVYSLLMAATCISVVRCCRVWEDARSILLVVIISLVALSTGLDELCVSNLNLAGPMLIGAGLFAFVICEAILFACRLRFPFWYRLSFYLLLALFFAAPGTLGYMVRNRHEMLANWGGPIFSALVATALLLLIPAIRAGTSMVATNGTPWQYPLYPLSAFAIIVVLAVIRSHALWMSFGFQGGPVQLEPFLLLPIAWAGLVLLVASDSTPHSGARTQIAMMLVPLLLFTGLSNDGMTNLPIQGQLEPLLGSAKTVAMLAIAGFYVFSWLCRARWAALAVATTILLIPWVGELSLSARATGVENWMFAVVATVVMLIAAFRRPDAELNWLMLATFASISLLTWGHDRGEILAGSVAALSLSIGALMMIGYMFDSQFATFARQLAATILVVTCAGTLIVRVADFHHLTDSFATSNVDVILVMLVLLTIGYMVVIQRTGWLYVGGMQLACLVAVSCWNDIQTSGIDGPAVTIQSGLACFAIGLTITSAKSGVVARHRRRNRWLRRFRRGY